MTSKSIFKGPGVQHFQLVHRSQRDPLINDPSSSKHVLKSFVPSNQKGKSRADLEKSLDPAILEHDRLAGVGEASLYGIYYDDTEYDYMQHLRSVGEVKTADTVLLPSGMVPKSSQNFKHIDIPAEALPSVTELPRSYVYDSHAEVPASISGLQPDMDPHLRQVLEALEDDAFVSEDLDDDFFGELVSDGKRRPDEVLDYGFTEQGDDALGDDKEGLHESDWEARFARFKLGVSNDAVSDGGGDTEGGDTVGHLPSIAVLGGKRRRKGSSEASGYSMSSASISRTEARQTLDERFEVLMEREYSHDDDDENITISDIDDEPPNMLVENTAFASLVDSFLGTYEQLGRRLKPKLDGETGIAKLDTLRQALGKNKHTWNAEQSSDEEDTSQDSEPEDKPRWDCETVLSTYSNLENHPRLIRARDLRPVPRIELDKRTGFPAAVLQDQSTDNDLCPASSDSVFSNARKTCSIDALGTRVTVTRLRNESKTEKRARKTAVKTDRQARRNDKRAHKEIFGRELKLAKTEAANREKPKLRKL